MGVGYHRQMSFCMRRLARTPSESRDHVTIVARERIRGLRSDEALEAIHDSISATTGSRWKTKRRYMLCRRLRCKFRESIWKGSKLHRRGWCFSSPRLPSKGIPGWWKVCHRIKGAMERSSIARTPWWN